MAEPHEHSMLGDELSASDELVGQSSTLIHDVPVPPGYCPPQPQHAAPGRQELGLPPKRRQAKKNANTNTQPQQTLSAFDSMDLDEQGGIPINQSYKGINENAFAFDPAPPPVSHESYLQVSRSQHDDASWAWRLPVEPYKGTDDWVLSKAYVNHPYAMKYHKNCSGMRKQWHCEADDAVPAVLRQQTPYSMLMLVYLRKLASHSRNNLELAQSLMMEAWRERISQTDMPPPLPVKIVQTISPGRLPNGKDKGFCENEIEENFFGLMLADVSKAIEGALHHKRAARKEHKTRRRAQRGERRNQMLKAAGNAPLSRAQQPRSQSEIAARVVQRAQIRRAQQQEITQYFQRIPFDEGLHPTQPAEFVPLVSNGSSCDSHTFSLPIRPSAPASSQDRAETELSQTGDENQFFDDVEVGTDEVVFVPRGKRRNRIKGLQGLARLVNRVDLETSRNRDSIRQRRGDTVLPLEKVDLNSLTPLYQQGTRTTSEDLAWMGQHALPD